MVVVVVGACFKCTVAGGIEASRNGTPGATRGRKATGPSGTAALPKEAWMRFATLAYTALVGTMMVINVLGHARGGGVLAATYAGYAERLWVSPTTMVASIQVVPQ